MQRRKVREGCHNQITISKITMMQTGAGFSGEGLCSYQTLPGTEVSTNKHLQIWIQSLVLSKEESNFYPKKDLP